MENIPGIVKPSIHTLPQIKDRMTFIYLERCKINREDGAITATDEKGVIHIPAAAVSVLLLGPGTDITHRAMELIGDSGVSIVWVGEHGVRYYAGGCALTHSSRLLVKQAEYVSNQRKHLEVVRKMYMLRFKGEDVTGLTLQQLRGREGSRMRAVYKKCSTESGVKWNGREYDVDDFSASDPVNQALSAGNSCLYGLAHAVICALGCSPGLGFVHIGHELSFVYDVADLYKAETTIPIAFEIAAEVPDNLPSKTRRMVRDAFAKGHILEQMVHDIKYLFSETEESVDEGNNALYLWDDRSGRVDSGISYGDD